MSHSVGHPLPASLLRAPRHARRIPLRPLRRALASSWVEARRLVPVASLVAVCAIVGWIFAVVGLGFSTVTSGRIGSTLALGWVVFWSLPVIGEAFAGDVDSRDSRGVRALPFGGLHQLVVRLATCGVFVLGLTLLQSLAELLTWIVRGRTEAPWTYLNGLHWLAGGRHTVQIIDDDGSILRSLRDATNEGGLQ